MQLIVCARVECKAFGVGRAVEIARLHVCAGAHGEESAADVINIWYITDVDVLRCHCPLGLVVHCLPFCKCRHEVEDGRRVVFSGKQFAVERLVQLVGRQVRVVEVALVVCQCSPEVERQSRGFAIFRQFRLGKECACISRSAILRLVRLISRQCLIAHCLDTIISLLQLHKVCLVMHNILCLFQVGIGGRASLEFIKKRLVHRCLVRSERAHISSPVVVRQQLVGSERLQRPVGSSITLCLTVEHLVELYRPISCIEEEHREEVCRINILNLRIYRMQEEGSGVVALHHLEEVGVMVNGLIIFTG